VTIHGERLDVRKELEQAIGAGPDRIWSAARDIKPVELADALTQMPDTKAAKVIEALPFDTAVATLDQPELANKAAIICRVETAIAGSFLEAMSADQQADVFRQLTRVDRQRLLPTLDPASRKGLELLLTYPPNTAGGIMTTELLAVPSDWTVGQTLDFVRSHAKTAETIYVIYLVDPEDGRLVQAVSLRELILAKADDPVLDACTHREPIAVHANAPREDVARLLSKYNLIAVPVVDDAHTPIGVVTFDDVIDAIVAEQTEDVQRLGGSEPIDEPYMSIGFGLMIKKRAGWLCALFLSEMLTATAMQHFEGLIAKAVVLSLFIPLVMSSGGNSGSQATSLIIRALALRQVRLGDWWRVAVRELPTGIVLGAILGVIGFTRVALWQHFHLFDYGKNWVLVAATVGVALIGIVTFGSLAGSMLPFLLKRLGFDPASASAPFVATLVDVTGLLIYFSVAFAVLGGTLL